MLTELGGDAARVQPLYTSVDPACDKPAQFKTFLAPFDAPPGLPFAFDISVGVRKSDRALRDELDRALVRNRSRIDALLQHFGFPLAGKET